MTEGFLQFLLWGLVGFGLKVTTGTVSRKLCVRPVTPQILGQGLKELCFLHLKE
jgi:hypothetical protein